MSRNATSTATATNVAKNQITTATAVTNDNEDCIKPSTTTKVKTIKEKVFTTK